MRLSLIVVGVLVPLIASAAPSKQCVELRILEALASTGGLEQGDQDMITAARTVRCARGDADETWDWPNGKTARYANGRIDYPTGTSASYANGR